jgi:hypothetical protein
LERPRFRRIRGTSLGVADFVEGDHDFVRLIPRKDRCGRRNEHGKFC